MKNTDLHILWDWNGTLVNDMDLCVAVTNRFIKKQNGRQISREEYQQKFTFPVIDFYESIGFDFSAQSFADMAEDWIREYKSSFHTSSSLNGDVVKTLTHIADNGLKQSIFSACEINLLKHSIRHLELENFFHNIHGVDNNRASGKEDLAIQIIKESHVDPEATILFGDTVHDYEVAQNTGINCVLIANGHQDQKRLAKTGADILEHIGMVPAYLNSLQ
ncbi:MAG: HAD hydrolase-like protein [Lentisphaeraceae bacterium]|nr:HAD hydrolase-like protein [Lentisphaeraceae bacterium]